MAITIVYTPYGQNFLSSNTVWFGWSISRTFLRISQPHKLRSVLPISCFILRANQGQANAYISILFFKIQLVRFTISIPGWPIPPTNGRTREADVDTDHKLSPCEDILASCQLSTGI